MNTLPARLTRVESSIPRSLQHRPEWVELYQRLQAFTVATYEDAPLSFQHRLMREHGWSADYTERVWFEYKRFLFMLATTEHFICPAEDVDQIWHTHLIYTRSYWEDLCKKLIGKPLHHLPSRGGQEETAHFYTSYAATLVNYQQLFGEQAPADIWASPALRLQDTPYFRLVNTRTHWVTAKPTWFKSKWLIWSGLSSVLMLNLVSPAYAAPLLDVLENHWLMLLIAGLFVFLFVKGIVHGHRCPQCKQARTFYKTGVISREQPPTTEYRCNACGHHEWRAQSSGGGGSGGGGSGGGCGGSGG